MNPMPICFLFVGNDISKHIELDRYGLPRSESHDPKL